MNQQIQISQTEGGSGVVFVTSTDGEEPIAWFQLDHSGNPIILAEFIDSNLILAINQAGLCGVFDLTLNKINQLQQIAEQYPVAALILDAKNQFALITRDKFSTKRVLKIFDIHSLKELTKIILPSDANIGNIWQISEHQLGIYFLPGGSLDKKPGDGIYIADINSQTVVSKCFSYPSSCTYGPSPLDISQKHQVGIRPRFDQVRIVAKGNQLECPIRVQLFNPENGEELNNIIVRNLSSQHIFEDTNPENAFINLNLPMASDAYQETRDEVLDRITDIKICSDEPAFWVAFQHGLIRKISLDGQNKTPLLAHPGDKDHLDTPYVRTNCDNPIVASPQNSVVAFGIPAVQVDLESVNLSDQKDLIILNDSHLMPKNQTIEKILFDYSWTDITVTSVNDNEALLAGFNSKLPDLKDINKYGDGDLFRFCFRDASSVKTEKDFFKRLDITPAIAKNIERYLKHILAADRKLSYRIGVPAGFYAMRQLILFDKQYASLLNRYLSSALLAIKDDPKVYIDMMAAVYEKYGWINETLDLLLTRAYFQPGSGMDQFLKYWSSDLFRTQIKTKGLFGYLTDHSIFKSLSDEYFALINPNEEALFSAIEKDNFQDLVEVLKNKALQIDMKHPEFGCSALALAIQQENQQIIDAMIEKGADVNTLDQSDLLYIIAKKNNAFTDQERQMIQVTIETLNEEKQILSDQLAKIQYDELLSISTSKEQINQVEYLKNRIQMIIEETKYAELGLDKTGTQSLFDQVVSTESNEADKEVQYIKEEIFFDEKYQNSIVVVENLNTNSSQSDALDQLILLTENGYQDLITSNRRLLFYFKDNQREWLEATFFEQLNLDDALAEKLDLFIANLIKHGTGALWCDDEMQSGMYAIATLTLYDKKYIERLITYIKSDLIHHDFEKAYPSELVYDLLDEHGWCLEILKLVIVRAIKHGGEFAEDEFRILLKKGGLNKYLNEAEPFQLCMDLIPIEADNDEPTIQKFIDLIQKYLDT